MSAPRVCARCYAEVPGFHSYEKGWKCDDCRKVLRRLRTMTVGECFEEAKRILERDISDTHMAQILAMEESGEGVWMMDPEVDTTVVFTQPGDDWRKAWLAVYLKDGDWEFADRLEERIGF